MIELGSPHHLLDMGLRLAASGDVPGARDALVRAINSGDHSVVPQAATALGVLVADSDPATAEEALRLAIQSGDPLHGSRAAYVLGSLYQHHGQLPAALQMFEVATTSPEDETAASARDAVRELEHVRGAVTAGMSPVEATFTEGVQLRAAGDLAGAVAAFERCIASGDPEFAPYAGCQLGAILAAEHDYENAKPPLWLAVRSGHDVYAPLSAYVLVQILLEEGDRDAVRELLPVAARHPDPEIARSMAEAISQLDGSAQ